MYQNEAAPISVRLLYLAFTWRNLARHRRNAAGPSRPNLTLLMLWMGRAKLGDGLHGKDWYRQGKIRKLGSDHAPAPAFGACFDMMLVPVLDMVR